MEAIRKLEQLALDAHRAGLKWADFWATAVAELVNQACPYDRAAYRRLVQQLSHMVLCGTTSGMLAPGDDDRLTPWDEDDQATPHDTITQAKCQVPLFDMAGIGGSVVTPSPQRDRGEGGVESRGAHRPRPLWQGDACGRELEGGTPSGRLGRSG